MSSDDDEYLNSLTPVQRQYLNEVMSVFMRWYEESDMEDEEMADVASYAVDRFFGMDVDFSADFDLEE